MKTVHKLFTRCLSNSRRSRVLVESLEPRQLFSLLGVLPDAPLIDTLGANGSLTYSASTHSFDATGVPTDIIFDTSTFTAINIGTPSDFQLHITIDNTGNPASGSQSNDLVITGSIDVNGDSVPDYTGVLLTGKIQQFGFLDSGTNDAFDFRFSVTGGTLAPAYFTGKDIGLFLQTENSTFDGTFNTDFSAATKGTLGAIPPLTPKVNSISGIKFEDLTGNGFSADDIRLGGITVELFKDGGSTPFATTVTAADGTYSFANLPNGTYSVQEVVPAGWIETGGLGGYTIAATGGVNSTGNNFDNFNDNGVGAGQFATIGFWHNKNGQAVINAFNGGSTHTELGTWLATNFPNLFGKANVYDNAGLNALPGHPTTFDGLTNAQIANVYLNCWNPSGVAKNTYVQAFAVALGLYADTSALGGASLVGSGLASKFGFVVTTGGAGVFNIGSNGIAFGVANNTSVSVYEILKIADANFNATTGLFYGGNATKTGDLNNVLNGINTKGDIA